LGLADGEKLVLYKNENRYRPPKEIPFQWEHNKEYMFRIEVKSSNIKFISSGKTLIEYDDNDRPYLRDQIRTSLLKGSHYHFKDFKVGKLV
jgi:hypothetical protein